MTIKTVKFINPNKYCSKRMYFTADVRESFGKSVAKTLRNNALVPASIYMNGNTVLHISIPEKEISKAVDNYNFLNTCFEITLSGKKINVLPKSIECHPITEKVIHIEFKEIPVTGDVCVLVPISIVNRSKSIGIKAGGKLNVPKHNILIKCNPNKIPENIAIDIGNFGIGRSIYTRHLKADETFTFASDVFVLSILGRGRRDKGEDGEGETKVQDA